MQSACRAGQRACTGAVAARGENDGGPVENRRSTTGRVTVVPMACAWAMVARGTEERPKTAAPLQRAEQAIPGVAEAGDDVAAIVEVVVERGEVDVQVGIGGQQALDAERGANQGEDGDRPAVVSAHDAERGGRGATGSEHRVEDEHPVDPLRVLGQVGVVDRWLQRFLVSL